MKIDSLVGGIEESLINLGPRAWGTEGTQLDPELELRLQTDTIEQEFLVELWNEHRARVKAMSKLQLKTAGELVRNWKAYVGFFITGVGTEGYFFLSEGEINGPGIAMAAVSAGVKITNIVSTRYAFGRTTKRAEISATVMNNFYRNLKRGMGDSAQEELGDVGGLYAEINDSVGEVKRYTGKRRSVENRAYALQSLDTVMGVVQEQGHSIAQNTEDIAENRADLREITKRVDQIESNPALPVVMPAQDLPKPRYVGRRSPTTTIYEAGPGVPQ